MNKLLGHIKTVTKHRHKVFVHSLKAGIPLQGLMHDLSKLSLAEFIPGVKYYEGTRSPNAKERETLGASLGWMHHKGRNKHHYEYWTDMDITTKLYSPVRMPVKYVAEMFCDRVAASKTYRGREYTQTHPLNYFHNGRAIETMHPDTAALLESWLVILAEKGETAAFAQIKADVMNAKRARRGNRKRQNM